jgi:predicted PurR-regulated permease PerM
MKQLKNDTLLTSLTLLVPLIGSIIMGLIILNMNLLQGPLKTLNIIYFTTMIFNIVLILFDFEKMEEKEEIKNPVLYILGLILFYPISPIFYFYKKSKLGYKNHTLMSGLLSALLLITYLILNITISEAKQDALRKLNNIQRDFQNEADQYQREYEQMMKEYESQMNSYSY